MKVPRLLFTIVICLVEENNMFAETLIKIFLNSILFYFNHRLKHLRHIKPWDYTWRRYKDRKVYKVKDIF